MVSLGELSASAKQMDLLPRKLVDEIRGYAPDDTFIATFGGTPRGVTFWRVRTFDTGPGHITAIITGRHEDDTHLSTTAEALLDQLMKEWPRAYVRVIQHQAPPEERFEELFRLRYGAVGRRNIPLQVMYSEFGQHLVDG